MVNSDGIENQNRLGANIRGLRKAFGETQEDLFLALGLEGYSTSTISQYETGKRFPGRDILAKIAAHYRISEWQLLNIDYSNMKKIPQKPIGDISSGIEYIKQILPLICTEKAMMNHSFQEAYKLHAEVLNSICEKTSLDLEKINQCMENYAEARNQGIVEGAANRAWWMLFFGMVCSYITPEFWDNCDELLSRELSVQDIFKLGLLPSFDVERHCDEAVEWQEFVEEILKSVKKELAIDIYFLKHTKEYAELGEYYLALRHKFCILNNDLSKEINDMVGDEMLYAYGLMGNQYAQAFLSPHGKF